MAWICSLHVKMTLSLWAVAAGGSFIPPPVLLQIVPFVQCYSTAGCCVVGRAHPMCGSHASSRENKQFSDVSWHLQFFSPFHSSASQTVEHSSCLLAYVYHTYSLALISLLPLSLQGSPVELTTLCCVFPGCECDAALHSCWDALLFLSIYGPFPQAHSVQTRCH